jgi:hypothetical protein
VDGKLFKCLGSQFTDGKEKIPMCLEVIAVLVQYSIKDVNPESGNTLFDV